LQWRKSSLEMMFKALVAAAWTFSAVPK